MCYMCAERNKLRRVFSTAIDLVKARTGGGGWFVKFGRPKISEKIEIQSSLKLKLEIIIYRDSNMRAFTYDVSSIHMTASYEELRKS